MNNIFKAGDFTSGKMGDIFKQCYLHDIAIIRHKQFGESYMIPTDLFRALAKSELLKIEKFREFADMNFGSQQAFFDAYDDHCFEEITEYFGGELDCLDWFIILSYVLDL